MILSLSIWLRFSAEGVLSWSQKPFMYFRPEAFASVISVSMPYSADLFQSINPRTGKPLVGSARFDLHGGFDAQGKTNEALDQILTQSQDSFHLWQASTVEQKVRFCRKAAQLREERREELAMMASLEMGKNRLEALAEVDKCAGLCLYYASSIGEWLKPRLVKMETAHASVHIQALGVILGIMPWNFPFWQTARFCIPAICAGNVGLLKHASNVPQCAEAFCKLINEAAGQLLLQNLRLSRADTQQLIADRKIAGVSLTGSTAAGRAVAAAAGQALKPSVLELGGSDAYLVLEDADVDNSLEACFAGRRLNSGQSCISAKRLIVVNSIYDQFQERLIEKLEKLRFAGIDPKEDQPGDLAPMAREDLRDQLHNQVQRSIDAGARLLIGGQIPNAEGFYYPATLLGEVRPGMAAFDEELFGPVFVMIRARDETEALAWANQSEYGLGAAVFSKDLDRAERLARESLQAGSAFVNSFVFSDPKLPFGGIKDSGFGRELSKEGLLAFTNIKTVYVKSQRNQG